MGKDNRYPTEMKIRIVEEYLSGKGSQEQLAKDNKIALFSLHTWITNYKSLGAEGLVHKHTKTRYPAELKRVIVEKHLFGGCSISELRQQYKIPSDSIVRRWVKAYNSHREFKDPESMGVNLMAKGRATTLVERIEIVSHCLENNKDYNKTIEQYRVSYSQLYGWVKKYESGGIDALTDRRGKRKQESEMSETDKLRAQIKLKDAENLHLRMEIDLLKKLKELERGRR